MARSRKQGIAQKVSARKMVESALCSVVGPNGYTYRVRKSAGKFYCEELDAFGHVTESLQVPTLAAASENLRETLRSIANES